MNVFPNLACPTVADLLPLPVAVILEEQQKDNLFSQIREWIETKTVPSDNALEESPESLRIHASMLPDFQIRDGILCLIDPPLGNFQILFPHALLVRILELAHTVRAHEGLKKLILRLSRSFFWPNMRRDIMLYVSTCSVCDRFHLRRSYSRNPLHSVRVGFPGEILALDLVGGKEACPEYDHGNKCILVMIDMFSRYVVAVALPNQHAPTVCDALLKHCILIFGTARRNLSDQGTNFESAVFSNFCLLWPIHKTTTTAYHPASNGACERVNQTIKRGMQIYLNEQNLTEWDTVLPYVVFAYNTSVHSSTWFTPFS